jgi:hypothetical protein
MAEIGEFFKIPCNGCNQPLHGIFLCFEVLFLDAYTDIVGRKAFLPKMQKKESVLE